MPQKSSAVKSLSPKRKNTNIDDADLITTYVLVKRWQYISGKLDITENGEMAERVETHLKVYQMLYNNNTMH